MKLLGFTLYISLQLFRLASLVLFSIFLVYCTLWNGQTTVDCQNFTVYRDPVCGPYCWKTVWLSLSSLTSILWLSLLRKGTLPELRPARNRVLLKRLLAKPFFWSLSLILVLVIIYDALIMIQNHSAKIHVEIMVIASKVLTLPLIFQLNFTLSPSKRRQFSGLAVAAYCFTLLLYVLDNLSKFVIISAQVAFKFYTVDSIVSNKPTTIIDLVLMVVNGSLYHSFMQFFWNKLFLRDKDVLSVFRANLEDSLGISTENTRDE